MIVRALRLTSHDWNLTKPVETGSYCPTGQLRTRLTGHGSPGTRGTRIPGPGGRSLIPGSITISITISKGAIRPGLLTSH
eukprot:3738847-Rhodomonas_salina.1